MSLRRLWLQVHLRQLQGQGVAFEYSQRQQAFTKFLQYTQQSLTLALGALGIARRCRSWGFLVSGALLLTVLSLGPNVPLLGGFAAVSGVM